MKRSLLRTLSGAAAVAMMTVAGRTQAQSPQRADPTAFNGIVKLDVRESVPDWGPYTPTKVPVGVVGQFCKGGA